jgi:1,2-dihydroxy-3-keto-5-methylthiopentene dioxygenase
MAILEFRGETITDHLAIKKILTNYSIPFERWGTRPLVDNSAPGVLNTYQPEISLLKRERGYVSEDVVALDATTENLTQLLEKFSDEHHHSDDEVRFTVAGEGIFEINISPDERVKFTAQAGDLIVVPAWRRHLFYLTELKSIRCIRLFKDTSGWAAIYPYEKEGTSERALHFAQ